MKFSRLEKIYQKYVLSDIKDMLDKRQKAGDRVGTFDKSFVLSIFDNMVFFSSPVEITRNILLGMNQVNVPPFSLSRAVLFLDNFSYQSIYVLS